MQEFLSAPYMRILEVRDGRIDFGSGHLDPRRSLVGDLGACPVELVPTVHPGYHGGNLDDPNITIGAHVYLPVSVPGAMLYLGDVHATQGDTEWCGPLEVDALVTLRWWMVKQQGLDCLWTRRRPTGSRTAPRRRSTSRSSQRRSG